jgi:hypothetical protein
VFIRREGKRKKSLKSCSCHVLRDQKYRTTKKGMINSQLGENKKENDIYSTLVVLLVIYQVHVVHLNLAVLLGSIKNHELIHFNLDH